MHKELPAAPLLRDASLGMDTAWRAIVRQYTPLVFAVCRRLGIGNADADDVCGSVWLKLMTNLDRIHEPEALPGWLRTVTRRECLQVLRHRQRQIPTDPALFREVVAPGFDADLHGRELRDTARHITAALPGRDRRLLSLLFGDPAKTYREISEILGIPIGSIGPSRARCLARARRTPAAAALNDLRSDQLAG
ncbi:sigma-70 family RNA polymerase sigma factor [Amycolatopsis sp. A133]|uniref:RNA polymerase sigma factor n=1 Tax=Amycolatopsis sp. A133 TaxID=3064472 RepID=UPI0027F7A871|nr:sigma-70 family RNA polymerase sigma factor [Amycolatopsis sp. A133]MDQ7807491.1 sigma-70 family RNA polymerase sigma factor [Amycolatopsis sp. A133]